MEHSLEVMKIVEGALKFDRVKIKNYVELLVKKLKDTGEHSTAKKFERILVKSSNHDVAGITLNSILKTPIDQESRMDIADILLPEENDSKAIMNEYISEQVEQFILYYNNIDALSSAGLELPNTLLLFGPPGCGKTKLAEHISKRLNLPLVVARLDGLISSYLGSTAKNLRLLFEYAQKTPCILFLDEFDAIAKIRDDDKELGELKRIVNSLLQNIDSIDNESLIIAATNHDHILDPAIWRRFHYKMKIDLPNFSTRVMLIREFLGERSLVEDDLKVISSAFSNFTGAAIQHICNFALRESVIFNKKVTLGLLMNSYFQYIDLLSEFDIINVSSETNKIKQINTIKANHLREIDKKVFSYSKIANILELSKTYVGQLIRESGEVEDGKQRAFAD